MSLNKFVIIGQSNTGKSCLFDQIAEDMGLNPVGFRMKDFTIENEFRGYYFHSIVELEKYHNNVPIQTSLRKGKQRVQLKEVYDTAGVECLKNVLEADWEEYNCVVLDELGRGEYTSEEFANYIYKILDSDALVFILMKNVSNSVTTEIRKRRDVLLYDLDNMSQDEVLANIEEKLKK
ncbi:MAG: nucleoside-triphosphatase [Lachnospiraceae bacterium]|nr:nucleoside-triphosphatase [Lachnospiraceae bacterium]